MLSLSHFATAAAVILAFIAMAVFLRYTEAGFEMKQRWMLRWHRRFRRHHGNHVADDKSSVAVPSKATHAGSGEVAINVILLTPTPATCQHFNWPHLPSKQTTQTQAADNSDAVAVWHAAAFAAAADGAPPAVTGKQEQLSDANSSQPSTFIKAGNSLGHSSGLDPSSSLSPSSSMVSPSCPSEPLPPGVSVQSSVTYNGGSSEGSSNLQGQTHGQCNKPTDSGQVVHLLVQVLAQSGAADAADSGPAVKLWLIPSQHVGLGPGHPVLTYLQDSQPGGIVKRGSHHLDVPQPQQVSVTHGNQLLGHEREPSDASIGWQALDLNINAVSDLVFPLSSLLGSGAFGQVMKVLQKGCVHCKAWLVAKHRVCFVLHC